MEFFRCKESKMSLYAEVHPPRPYNSSDPDLGNSTGWAANATEAAGLLPAGTTQPQLLSVAAAAAGYRLPALPSIAPGRRVSTPTVPNAPRGQGAPEGMESGRADVSSRLERGEICVPASSILALLPANADVPLPQRCCAPAPPTRTWTTARRRSSPGRGDTAFTTPRPRRSTTATVPPGA